jgi:geranylgeranyl diphosphate synthase type II
MSETDLASHLGKYKTVVDMALEARLPSPEVEPRQVHAAMRYAALSEGKRLRPILSISVAEISGHPADHVLDAACAIEYVHTASLILDDLPCMDNGALRRSKPCTHLAYGEPTALLAVMGLIALAFDLVTTNIARHARNAGAVSAVQKLARAIGTAGLVRGQHMDLNLSGEEASMDLVEAAHRHKAGALFLASVQVPAYILGMTAGEIALLETYARNVGFAFQITDDLLDAREPAEDAGKNTFVTLLGVEGAQRKLARLVADAIRAIEPFGHRADLLRILADHVRTRAH